MDLSNSFHSSARNWLVSIIRQRDLLVKRGESRKNPALMSTSIEHLQKYLKAYRYNDDRKMAKFIVQNRSIILSILPGEGAAGHEKKNREFDTILTKSNQILANYENLHLWANQSGTSRNSASV